MSRPLRAQEPKRATSWISGRGIKTPGASRSHSYTNSPATADAVDAPGDALQLVVIDKLPFPPPNDPLVEARSQRLESQGRSAFSDYSLPEAAVALKQGAGRLIRRETDMGVLAICDTRLVAMGYGRRLLAALPPMRRIETEEDFDAVLADLGSNQNHDAE